MLSSVTSLLRVHAQDEHRPILRVSGTQKVTTPHLSLERTSDQLRFANGTASACRRPSRSRHGLSVPQTVSLTARLSADHLALFAMASEIGPGFSPDTRVTPKLWL